MSIILLTLQPVIPSCARNLETDALSVQRDEKETSKTANDTPVVNLSSVDLTESENCLLSKGLGFCPRPKSYDRGNLLHDTKFFSRRMRLKSHFNDRDDTNRSSEKYPSFSCLSFPYLKAIGKKSKRKVQGVPQSQTAALPRPQEEEETDKSKQAQTEQTYEKH